MPPPTVFVVDDDSAVRDGLRILLNSVGRRCACFDGAQAFLDAYDPARPGCLVLDIRMPGMSGLELQEHLRATGTPLPTIIVTGHGDVPAAVRAMKSDAIDFLEKPFNDQVLLDRIEQAIQIDAQDRRAQALREEHAARLGRLTPREREVMRLLVLGKPNKHVAAQLGVSFQAIAAHRTKIMKKLQAENIVDLVRQSTSPPEAPQERINRRVEQVN